MRKQIRSGLLFTILVGFATGCAYLNANYAAVVPGQYYRSGQMHETAFRKRVESEGIQTVISLRKPAPSEAWYENEQSAAADLGVAYHTLGWDKDRLPTPAELETFIHLAEESPKPVLVHCQGGVHRVSVASAIVQLLEDESLETAREQLILGFGRPIIWKLLDLYEGSQKPFAEWAIACDQAAC